jgi:hypothetical protein
MLSNSVVRVLMHGLDALDAGYSQIGLEHQSA